MTMTSTFISPQPSAAVAAQQEAHLENLLDIEMIAFVGGKERTADELRQLLATVGFALQRVVPTRSPLSLLEAVPC
jgi:hypothetical protein